MSCGNMFLSSIPGFISPQTFTFISTFPSFAIWFKAYELEDWTIVTTWKKSGRLTSFVSLHCNIDCILFIRPCSLSTMKVIVTGASGILGTAVYDAFKSAGHSVLGLARSRPTSELKSLDLLDTGATENLFTEFNPDWVVHCAAERRPDVADKDPEGAQKLNGDLPGHLAQLAKSLRFKLIYISTDYVFDGTSPPYAPSSQTNPVNLYGKTKLAGEKALLAVEGADVFVLRVPVLYGPAPKNSDTAVNTLLDVVLDQSGKQYKMDHYATRYPTNVVDVAAFLVKLAGRNVSVSSIVHFSAAEPYTKYEMCLVFAKILGLPHSHIVPDAEAPKGEAAVSRPRDCRLNTSATEQLLGGGDLGCVIFDEWWAERLKGSSSGSGTK